MNKSVCRSATGEQVGTNCPDRTDLCRNRYMESPKWKKKSFGASKQVIASSSFQHHPFHTHALINVHVCCDVAEFPIP